MNVRTRLGGKRRERKRLRRCTHERIIRTVGLLNRPWVFECLMCGTVIEIDPAEIVHDPNTHTHTHTWTRST